MIAQSINIVLQGTVYWTNRPSSDDNPILQLLCNSLSGLSPELSFDALYRKITLEWKRRDDIPYPFGDRRDCLVSALWIIDLDNDVLRLRKKDQNRRISLSKLREGPVSISQMELFDPIPLPKYSLTKDFSKPTWKPEFKASQRQTAFIGRILEDFSHQWRHVLRSRYNDSTFRRLARAILRIATLDFRVKEIAFSRAGVGGPLVWLNHVPEWEPFHDRVIHLDRVTVILCQHLTGSLAAIREDFGPRRQRYYSLSPPETACDSVTYLVFSVREVFLYKASVSGKHASIYTEPETLFNGIEPPSKRALEFLLMAAPSESVISPIHKLPTEVQNIILESVSLSPVEAARIGCLLALGSPFQWKSNDRKITRQEVLTNKAMAFPVESEIWFDDRLSGLVYR